MNSPKMSRNSVFAGLVANHWVSLFQKEDPTMDPVFNYHGIELHLTNDYLSAASATVIIQDSKDGITWTTRATSAAIVPAGEATITTFFHNKYVRALAYSTGAGRIDGTLLTPEDHVTPSLNDKVTLACAAYCEVHAES